MGKTSNGKRRKEKSCPGFVGAQSWDRRGRNDPQILNLGRGWTRRTATTLRHPQRPLGRSRYVDAIWTQEPGRRRRYARGTGTRGAQGRGARSGTGGGGGTGAHVRLSAHVHADLCAALRTCARLCGPDTDVCSEVGVQPRTPTPLGEIREAMTPHAVSARSPRRLRNSLLHGAARARGGRLVLGPRQGDPRARSPLSGGESRKPPAATGLRLRVREPAHRDPAWKIWDNFSNRIKRANETEPRE